MGTGNRSAGLFITFEGIDGVGKTTQARRLAHFINEQSQFPSAVLTFEPGGTKLGQAIRHLLLSDQPGAPRVLARAEALLYAADRAEHAAEVIRPALESGKVIISDRYIDSSLAYQSGGRELSANEIAKLSAWATGNLTPDRTYVLDMPVTTAHRRIGVQRHESLDRMESEPDPFQNRVRQCFLQLAHDGAQSGSDRYRVIDASGSEDDVWEQIKADFVQLYDRAIASRAAK
jgi:dTMP kinase